MIIPVYNPETTDYEKSYLATPFSAGVTSIVVKDSDRFAINDRILLGAEGVEKSEIVTVSAISADGITLTIGATVYPHSADDPVYRLQFDQVKYYRSTTGSTGTYSVLTTVNLDVDNASLQTVYDDTTGLSTYYYKVSFYHSLAAVESALSDAIPGGGFNRNQVGYIIDEVLQEVSDLSEQFITRNEIIGYFNDVNDELTSFVSKPYEFLRTRTALTRTAGRSYIDFPTDSSGAQIMWKFDYMDYNFTDSTTTPVTDNTSTIKVIPVEEFRNTYTNNTISTTTESDAKPVAMTLDTSVNRFRFSSPFLTTLSNVFYLHYWKYFTRIDSEGDVIETPTPHIYKLYIKMAYYRKRSIADVTLSNTAQTYAQEYQAEKSRFKQLDRKDQGTPRAFRPMSDTQRDYRR